MKPVFVREQDKYTKDALMHLFGYDESSVRVFIKELKVYGILKSIKKELVFLELSDLKDNEIEISDGTESSGSCLYVFSFVGVITYRDRVIISYPKYLSSGRTESDLLDVMKQILKVLEKYNKTEEQIINLYNGNGENKKFNILSVILYLIRDFYEYGLYTSSDEIVEIDGEGEINWGKTIDDGFALISKGRPYYTELFTRRTINNDSDFITKLHEYVISDCSRQLRDSQLESLFGIETEMISNLSLDDFGKTDYILERILKELSIQFNTRKQVLLKTMYAYFDHNRKMLDDKHGFSMYGSNSFHIVWEKMCSIVFDNKRDETLKELKLKANDLSNNVDNAVDFTLNNKLIEVIKKPIWENKQKEISYEAEATLIPDIITLPIINGEKWFVILDAKYYNIKLEVGTELVGNPGVGDVTKQYLYQLAYNTLIKFNGIKHVRNCFLMPTENDKIMNYGIARMPIFDGMNLENIQILLIPACEVMRAYLDGTTISEDNSFLESIS